jgi:hypothetical protein
MAASTLELRVRCSCNCDTYRRRNFIARTFNKPKDWRQSHTLIQIGLFHNRLHSDRLRKTLDVVFLYGN